MVKDAREIAMLGYGIMIVLSTRGDPRKYTQSVVKAKLPKVDMKVIVQERLTSP